MAASKPPQADHGVALAAFANSSSSARSRCRFCGNSACSCFQNEPARIDAVRSPRRACNCARRTVDTCSDACVASTASKRASFTCASSALLVRSSWLRCAATSGASFVPAAGLPSSASRACTLVSVGASASATLSASALAASASARICDRVASSSSASPSSAFWIPVICLRKPSRRWSAVAASSTGCDQAGAAGPASRPATTPAKTG